MSLTTREPQPVQDALVVGGGPAGRSAALTLARACRTVTIFDSGEYRNELSDGIHNVLTYDRKSLYCFLKLSAIEIRNYQEITYVPREVIRARRISTSDSDGQEEFHLFDAFDNCYKGKKLILASGSRDILPPIPGFKSLWGSLIFNCALTGAFEKRGGRAGVLGLKSLYDPGTVLMACHIAENDFTIYTNGENPNHFPFQDNLEKLTALGCQVDTREIQSLARTGNSTVKIQFTNGEFGYCGFLICIPFTENRSQNLIKQLEIVTTGHHGHAITAASFNETNVPGCFLAGDNSTLNKTIPAALYTGTLAGAGAARALAIDEGWRAAIDLSYRD